MQREAEAWVSRTLKTMTLDEKAGQLLVASIDAAFTSTDTDAWEQLRHLVKDLKVGGLHVFGAGDSVPQLLLNQAPPGGARGGDPLAAHVGEQHPERLAAVRVDLVVAFKHLSGQVHVLPDERVERIADHPLGKLEHPGRAQAKARFVDLDLQVVDLAAALG